MEIRAERERKNSALHRILLPPSFFFFLTFFSLSFFSLVSPSPFYSYFSLFFEGRARRREWGKELVPKNLYRRGEGKGSEFLLPSSTKKREREKGENSEAFSSLHSLGFSLFHTLLLLIFPRIQKRRFNFFFLF